MRKKQTASQRAHSKRVHASWRKREKRKKSLGSSDRFVVSGPARYKRSFHASESAALKAGHACSRQFPNAVCRVERGLPGMQQLVAECNRNECDRVGGFGKRRKSVCTAYTKCSRSRRRRRKARR